MIGRSCGCGIEAVQGKLEAMPVNNYVIYFITFQNPSV